jgi:hypothetical protein
MGPASVLPQKPGFVQILKPSFVLGHSVGDLLRHFQSATILHVRRGCR